jgi:hypothetical protein
LEKALEKRDSAKHFLLGNLSDAERADMEDRFLAHDDVYQELLIAENDLIDAYVRRELPAPERALFEQRLLSSQHWRERVEFAETLFNPVSNTDTAAVQARVPERRFSLWQFLSGALFIRHPAFGFTVAAASLALVLSGLWFLTDKDPMRLATQQQQQTQQAQTTPPTTPVAPRESSAPIMTAENQQPIRNEKNSNRKPIDRTPKRVAPVIATFTLLPGTLRSESNAGALVMPAEANKVQLRLTLDGDAYKKYRATLSTPEGRKLWSRDVTKSSSQQSPYLILSLPANLLKSGDYVLDLSGTDANSDWESVADYIFRVIKK